LSKVLKPKKGYKTVIGDFREEFTIPDDWKISSLKTLCNKLKSGGTPKSDDKDYYGGEISFASIVDISNSERFLEKTVKTITKKGLENSNAWIIPKNSLLYSMYATVGKPVINKIETTTHQGILGILVNKKKMDNKFLCYVLLSIRHKLVRYFLTNTQSNINLEISKNLKIIHPEKIQEQQKISSILSNIDDLISNIKKIIDQTILLKKGLMQKLLTKGISHKKFKKVNLGRYFINYEIPEEWELSTLSNYATVHGRIGWKNLRSDEYLEDGFLMLSVWSLVESSSYGINFTAGVKRLSQFRYDESPEIQLQNGDVLVAKDGDIGRIGFIKNLPEPTTVNSHLVPVRVNKESLNPEFLYWFFKSKPFQTYCKAFTSGTTIPLFTQNDLRNAIIPIPKKEEQNKIITILSNTDSQIISQTQYKEKLGKLKKSLMQKLLTGQVSVTA